MLQRGILLFWALALLNMAVVRLDATPPAVPAPGWVALDYWQLQKDGPLDGDSFCVVHNSQRYEFQLYFVDAPETTRDRLDLLGEQARFFGLNIEETLALGQEAKSYTESFLKGGSRILTRWERVGDPSTQPVFYAVAVRRQDYLAEQLIARGLGRLDASEPETSWYDGLEKSAFWGRLQVAERMAKNNRVGLWHNHPDDLLTFLSPEELPAGYDSSPHAPYNHPSPAARINLNYATERELQRLRGIGPVLAHRIVEGRPYTRVEDLLRVPGITDSTLERLRPYVVVER